jgi:hypothetical protein
VADANTTLRRRYSLGSVGELVIGCPQRPNRQTPPADRTLVAIREPMRLLLGGWGGGDKSLNYEVRRSRSEVRGRAWPRALNSYSCRTCSTQDFPIEGYHSNELSIRTALKAM